MCRKCRSSRAEETGTHIIPIEGERLGKLFGGWKYAENPKGVFRRVQEGDKVVTDDLAEAFLSKLGIP